MMRPAPPQSLATLAAFGQLTLVWMRVAVRGANQRFAHHSRNELMRTRMLPYSLILFQFCLSMAISGCGGPPATERAESGGTSGANSASTTIRIDGSSTVYPISSLVNEMYFEGHSEARITVGYSGTGGGMKKFIEGDIDICNASRAIKPEEVEECRDMGIDFLELPVASDGLAVVVSPENTWCDCLTREQLKRIWQPDNPATTWRDVDPNWPDETIQLYGPGIDSGTFDYFTEEIVGEAKRCRSDFSPSENDNVLVTGVSSSKYALGYFGFYYYDENREKLKLLGIDGGEGCVQPTMATVLDGTYSLSRPLFIYVRTSKLPQIGDFVEFYLEHAADAVREVGYVPIDNETQAKNLAQLAAKRKQ